MAALGEDTLADKDLHPELQGVREREKGVTYDRRGRMCEFVSLTGGHAESENEPNVNDIP